jgi:hypothetical protein
MEECCTGKTACAQLRSAAKSGFSRFCELVPNQCSDGGRLLHLSLVSEGLTCPFPKGVSRLSALTRLDLTFNQLSGRQVLHSAPSTHSEPAQSTTTGNSCNEEAVPENYITLSLALLHSANFARNPAPAMEVHTRLEQNICLQCLGTYETGRS